MFCLYCFRQCVFAAFGDVYILCREPITTAFRVVVVVVVVVVVIVVVSVDHTSVLVETA